MRSIPFRQAKSAWPLLLPALVALAGLAAGGTAGAVGAFTLAFLVVGPAYLLRQRWLRRHGRLPHREPRTPRQHARLFRMMAVVYVVVAVPIVVAAAERGDWLPGRGWSAFLTVTAIWSAASAPGLWVTADRLENAKRNRRAHVVAGTADILVALGFLAFAAENHWGGWPGGGQWTLGLGAIGALWLVTASGHLACLRAEDH